MKHLLTLLAFAIAISASAQTSKGSWMVGGSFKIQRTASDALYFGINGTVDTYTIKNASLSFTPTVGYFFIKNFMTGIQLTETNSWTLNQPNNSVRTNNFGIGPILRYYVPIGKFALFPEMTYQFTWQKQSGKFLNQPTDTKIKGSIVRTGLGLAWFATPNVGVEGILAYQSTDMKETNLNDAQILYYSIGLQFYFSK